MMHIRWHRAAAWRAVILVILLGLPAYIICDSFLDASGLDDDSAFDVADDGMIVNRQPIESQGQVSFRSDLPVAADPRLPALADPSFAHLQPFPAILLGLQLPGRNSRARPRATLMASSPTPTLDPAS